MAAYFFVSVMFGPDNEGTLTCLARWCWRARRRKAGARRVVLIDALRARSKRGLAFSGTRELVQLGENVEWLGPAVAACLALFGEASLAW
jgi:hypothetical protein